jgi:RNA polymerase sigma-70 factor (ECF subfamily)
MPHLARRAGTPGTVERDESDEALMVRDQRGDVRAFELLLTRHRKPVFNFILRFVREPAQAEDLLQETFLRVIKGVDAYEKQAKFTTWLYTIARNLCTDHARRAVSRDAVSLDGSGRSEDSGARPLMDRLPAPGLGTDREALGKELAARIDVAVAALPVEQREVFLMREVMEMPFAEIAAAVGASEPTVKSRMRYALERLRVALEEFRDVAAGGAAERAEQTS